MIKHVQKTKPLFHKTKKLIFTIATTLCFSQLMAGTWYVNDGSLTGDVFTTAIGNDANTGTSADPFATVQFAINTAAAGDTIYVDAGTYSSADITVSKTGIVLRGAKFGVPAGPDASPVGRGTDESIIDASIYYGQSRDGIVVDGFTIDAGTRLRGIEARGLNSVIINNIVTGTITPFVQQAGISTRANAPNRVHSYQISYNNVQGFRFGIYMDGNTENQSEISFNYVTGCFSAGFVLTASNGHILKANVSDNNSTGLLCLKANNLIQQNTFTNNTIAGIRLAATSQTSGNNILFNFITNNAVGIALTEDDPGAVNNSANYNFITPNVLNIGNAHTANFNATCNWYGTTDVVTIASLIAGNVLYNPFLTDGIDTDPDYGFQPITTCIVAPIILTDFNATTKDYDVVLRWKTSSEINSSYFSIERSLDGIHFSPIGRVAANGFTSTTSNYSFTDNKPVNFDKPTFYRLNMVDRDGSSKNSKILNVTLKTNGSKLQQVYPNPVTAGALINANFIAANAENINISLVNAVGQVLTNAVFQAQKGSNQISMKVPAGANGVNFLVIKSAGVVQKVPVYIQ